MSVHPLIKDLVALRYRRGLSQQNIADRLFISRAAIGKFETNGRHDHYLGTIEAYAGAVGAEVVMREVQPCVDPCRNPEHWELRA